MQVIPTINFAGNCSEAIRLYAEAFGGRIAFLITYRQANDPAYMPLLTEAQKDSVYHAELMLGDQRIIMSDRVDIDLPVCCTNFLTVMYDTKEEVQRAYALLPEGSTTIYPMEATPYSSCRGAVVDRFGIRWGVMTESTEA